MLHTQSHVAICVYVCVCVCVCVCIMSYRPQFFMHLSKFVEMRLCNIRKHISHKANITSITHVSRTCSVIFM